MLACWHWFVCLTWLESLQSTRTAHCTQLLATPSQPRPLPTISPTAAKAYTSVTDSLLPLISWIMMFMCSVRNRYLFQYPLSGYPPDTWVPGYVGSAHYLPRAGSGSTAPLIHLLILVLYISFACLHRVLCHLSFFFVFSCLSFPVRIDPLLFPGRRL